MNTANKLTILRLLMVPVLLAVLYIEFRGSNFVAMGIFIIAGITDIADGYIARTYGQVTDFGKFMDPLADKILVFSVMLWFVQQGSIPAWVAIIVITREFLVTGLRLIAIVNKRIVAAELSGKIKTTVTIVCLVIMFLPIEDWMLFVLLGAILTTTVYSGIDYFLRNKDILKMEMK